MLAVKKLFRLFSQHLTKTQEQNSGMYRQKVRTMKDRYEIHTLTNIEFMCNLVRTTKFQLSLNEHIILLYRMTQVFSMLNKSTYYYSQFDSLVYSIIAKFKHPQDYSCLGTFALTVARLGKYDSEHWVSICDYVLERKYDDEHDQVFALITAFEKVGESVQNDWVRERVVQLYRQLNETLLLHTRQKKYNLKEMRRLAHCLYKYKFYEVDYWEEVGLWVRSYIGQLEQKPMESFFLVHESQVERCLFDEKIRPVPLLEELNELVFFLSNNQQPCLEFLQFTERLVAYAMQQGSKLLRRFKEIEELQHEQLSQKKEERQDKTEGSQPEKESKHHHPVQLNRPYRTVFVNAIELQHQHVLMLLFNIRRILKEYRDYSIDQRVVGWLSRLIPKQYNRYTIHQLLLLHESAQFLGYTPQFMMELILQKLQTLRQESVSMDDLKNIFDLIGTDNLHIMQPIVLKFQRQSHPALVLKFTKFMQQYLKYMPSYFAKLPAVVNTHHKYYSFDENCYFFYTLIVNQVYWMGAETGTLEYTGEMEKLKQTIKVSAFSRGFKLTIDSYFHKVLEHVNLADFFEGGS